MSYTETYKNKVMDYFNNKIAKNKLRSVPGVDILNAMAEELVKRKVTSSCLDHAFSLYFLTTENPSFFPSFPAIIRNLPENKERENYSDSLCTMCNGTGQVLATLIKQRCSKDNNYVGSRYMFKCYCPTGQNIGADLQTWSSSKKDYFSLS